MRYSKTLTTVLSLALLALSWSACGPADAQHQQGDGDEVALGFVDRIFQPAPEPVGVPAGTLLSLQLQDTLSSHETPIGTTFTALVTQEVSVGGRVAVPAGSTVTGRVAEARAAKKIGGRAILALSFDSLATPNGDKVEIEANVARLGRSEAGRDAAIIGGSTIGGAILGEAIHEGEGTTVGAIVGGIAGTVGALQTRGKPVELQAGSELHIELDRSITVKGR